MVGDEPFNSVPEKARSILTPDEEIQLYWDGQVVMSENEKYPAYFGATNKRLLYTIGENHFKDIGFEHIESVEVASTIERENEGTHPSGLVVIGGVAVIVGIGAMVVSGFSSGGILFGLGVLVLGGVVVAHAMENYDELEEDFEVTEYEIYHVMLSTSATSHFSQPIYFETTENVGPELSRLVQEAK